MSENHETCWYILLWCVEAVVKNWESFEQVVTLHVWNPDISTCDDLWSCVEMFGFYKSKVIICSKLFQFFMRASARDNKTPQQVLWFSDFVWIFYNLNTLSL